MRHTTLQNYFSAGGRVKKKKKRRNSRASNYHGAAIDQMYNKCIMYIKKCMGNSPIYMKNVKSDGWFGAVNEKGHH